MQSGKWRTKRGRGVAVPATSDGANENITGTVPLQTVRRTSTSIASSVPGGAMKKPGRCRCEWRGIDEKLLVLRWFLAVSNSFF